MKRQKTFWLILAAIIVIGIIWMVSSKTIPEPELAAYTFSNKTSSIEVSFNEDSDTAILNGEGYEGLVFERGISASGARYVNDSEDLVLWNKGNEMTLYKNDEPIFVGTTKSDNEEATPANASMLFGSIWKWQKTVMGNDDVITPKKPGVFTLAFEQTGKVSVGTDCNGAFGNYTSGVGGSLSIGPLASTLMYCEGSQENEFTKMLSDTSGFMFTKEGDLVLLLKYDSGSVFFNK
jgi:heat shock protein HslJ/membrane-bound inhibitor of C-type lysozyme